MLFYHRSLFIVVDYFMLFIIDIIGYSIVKYFKLFTRNYCWLFYHQLLFDYSRLITIGYYWLLFIACCWLF